MFQDAFDALAKLGLKRDEAKIYLACLRNKGGLFMHEIARISKVNRSTVDLIIRRLLARNFLSSFREGRRRKFVAESPERLLFDFQRDLEDFRTVIPRLMRLSTNAEQTRVTLHEGAKGVQAALDEIILTLKILPEKERINYTVISGREIEKIRPRFHQQFIARRVQNRMPCHMIAVRSEPRQTWPSSSKDLRVVKMFDGKDNPLNLEIELAGDKIFLFLFTRPLGAIAIQNKTIATSLRSLFNLVWETLGLPEPDLDSHHEDKAKKRFLPQRVKTPAA